MYRHRVGLGALALAVLPAVASCFAHTNDVTFLRSQLPSLPAGCPVSVLADAVPPFPVEELVVVTVRFTPGGRDRAMHEVSDKTCYYGGDTVYRIEETEQSNATTLLRARIARRAGAAPAASSAPPSP